MKEISKQSDNRWTKELYQTRKEWNIEKLEIQGQVDLELKEKRKKRNGRWRRNNSSGR